MREILIGLLAFLLLICLALLNHKTGQGKEITLWIIDTVAKYNECSALNDAKNKALN
ncbi:MAG: hypothetical protein I4N51_08675 [Acinetobacter sp.]|nr:hypothetical protein [Acinetobacter sp.]